MIDWLINHQDLWFKHQQWVYNEIQRDSQAMFYLSFPQNCRFLWHIAWPSNQLTRLCSTGWGGRAAAVGSSLCIAMYCCLFVACNGYLTWLPQSDSWPWSFPKITTQCPSPSIPIVGGTGSVGTQFLVIVQQRGHKQKTWGPTNTQQGMGPGHEMSPVVVDAYPVSAGFNTLRICFSGKQIHG